MPEQIPHYAVPTSWLDANIITDLEARIRVLEARNAALETALVEAMLPLEALHAAGGTGIQDEIAHAVALGRAVLFTPHTGEEASDA